MAGFDSCGAAPVLALADEAHGLAALPAEIGSALELAGDTAKPGAVLALRRANGMATAGQTEVARGAAVLDDQHQGEDQNRSYEDASYAVNIGI